MQSIDRAANNLLLFLARAYKVINTIFFHNLAKNDSSSVVQASNHEKFKESAYH